MIKFYILPVERVTRPSGGFWRGPKYFQWRFDPDPPGIQCPCSLKDYGLIDFGVVAVDIQIADDEFLRLQSDVFAFPENLDVNMPQADMTSLTNFLEIAFVPATNWLNGSLTYRAVLRTITAMFIYMQGLTSIAGSPLDWGITLNTRFRNLSLVYQTAIRQTFTNLGFDSSFITDNSTIRQILKSAADLWGSKPIYFGFATL